MRTCLWRTRPRTEDLRKSAIGCGWRLLTLFSAIVWSIALTQASARADSTIEDVQKTKTLRVGWATYFPYMYVDPKTQQLSGITVDVFQEIGKELGAKPVFVEDSWATLIAGFHARKYDLMMPLVDTPQRAEVVGFTRPITKIAVGLAVLKDNVAQYKTWEDLDKPGKRISTTMGSSIQTVVTPKLKQAELLLVKSGSESVAQILANRADAWANTYDAFKFMQKEQPNLVVVPGPPMGFDRVALSFRKGDERTKEWLEGFIAKLRSSGALLQIMQKYGLDETYLAE
jgi:ABC-type amino acid transport substrate-binding protein